MNIRSSNPLFKVTGDKACLAIALERDLRDTQELERGLSHFGSE
ncbi:MAG: hypothetical protein PHZ02_08970 [Desulfocapsaceae bacterium]|nr:hypothetical protein [Desulfocapsaceae bacterium]